MLNEKAFLLVIAKLKYEISDYFMLVNNLLVKESTAGETRVRLMSRSEFVLTIQRNSQPNAKPK